MMDVLADRRGRFPIGSSGLARAMCLLMGIALGAVSAPGLTQGAKKAAKPKGRPPPPVVVSVASERMLAPVTWYPGTVMSRHQARLSAEVSGRLEWVAEVGDKVVKGDAVARIDRVLLEQLLVENQAAISREQARLRFLEAEVVRLKKLVAARTTTASKFEAAVAGRGVTRSELAAARALAASTRERIARTVVRSPFAGVVAERFLQSGEWADNGDAVVHVVDVDSVEVQAWVPVQALEHITQGTVLALRGNPHDIDASVRTIVPVGHQRSRLYELRLIPAKGQWVVGRSVRLAVPTATARTVIAVAA